MYATIILYLKFHVLCFIVNYYLHSVTYAGGSLLMFILRIWCCVYKKWPTYLLIFKADMKSIFILPLATFQPLSRNHRA